MTKIIVAILMVFVWASTGYSTTYWVDSVGTVTNKANCSGEIPLDGADCCTPATLFNATDLAGGDIVYFRAGDGGLYTSSAGSDYGVPAYYPHSSGASWENPLIFKAYNNEEVVFRQGNRYPIIGINQKNFITLDGFTIWANNGTNDFGPGVIHGASGSYCRGIRILNSKFEGYTISTNGDLYRGLHIIYCSSFLVSNCLFRNFLATGGDTANVAGLDTYNIEDRYGEGCVIEKSTFYHNNQHLSYKAGNSVQQYDLHVRQCLFYDLDPNNDVDGNWPMFNIGYTSRDGEFYQNIFIDGGFGTNDSGNKYTNKFYNNTFIGGQPGYDGTPNGANFAPYAGALNGWEWYNNLHRGKGNATFLSFAYGTNYGAPAAGGIDYNWYYNPNYSYNWEIGVDDASTFANWQGDGYDTHGTSGTDPQFVSYAATPTDTNGNGYYDGDEIGIYKLASGSPALTASNTGGAVGAFITGSEQIGYLEPEQQAEEGGGSINSCTLTGVSTVIAE